MTAAGASGYTEVDQILPEEASPMDQDQEQEAEPWAGSSTSADPEAAGRKRQENVTLHHRTAGDDQDEICSCDYLPPEGISRKRQKNQEKQLLAGGKVRRTELAEGTMVPENTLNEAAAAAEETPERLIPTYVKIVIYVIFLFVVFTCITSGRCS